MKLKLLQVKYMINMFIHSEYGKKLDLQKGIKTLEPNNFEQIVLLIS